MAATTNFVQHNPTAANQESDATFDANSLTNSGIGVDAIMPSDWMNKRWRQDSVMVAAIAQMLLTKGYSTSDADLSTLAAVLANIVTNADLKPNLTTIAFSPTPAFDASKTNGWEFTLSGNVTSSTLVGFSTYQIITFVIKTTGAFTFAWPSNVVQPPTIPAAGSTGMNSANVFSCQFIVLEDGKAYPLNEEIAILLTTKQDSLGFTPIQQGGGTNQLTDKVYIGWDGARLRAQVDTTDLGQIAFGNIPTLQSAMTSSANVAGTLYTNTSGRMRFVSVTYSTSGGNTGTMTATVDGIQQIAQDFTATLSNGNACIQFMVRPGSTYIVNLSGSAFGGSGGVKVSWIETDFGLV